MFGFDVLLGDDFDSIFGVCNFGFDVLVLILIWAFILVLFLGF